MNYAISDDLLAVNFDPGERKLNRWKIKFWLLLGGFSHPKSKILQEFANAICKLNQGEMNYVMEGSFKFCHDFTMRIV